MYFSFNKVLLCCYLIYHVTPSDSSRTVKEQKYINLFRKILDINGDGKFDKTDSVELSKRLAVFKGYTINGKEYDKIKDSVEKCLNGLIKQSAAEKLGYVTEDQWIKLGEKSAIAPAVDDLTKHYENVTFSFRDKNGDGVVTEDEFVPFLLQFGVSLEDAVKGFAKIAQGKGSVNRKDFTKLWDDFFTSEDISASGNFLLGEYNFDNY